MSAWLVVLAIALCGASGVVGLRYDRASTVGERVTTALMMLGGALGLVGAGLAIAAPSGVGLRFPWDVPGAALDIQVDGISAMFLIQIFLLTALGSIYGLGYWRQADHPENGRKLRLFYGTLAASMALVVVARNTTLFLFGWEIMAVSAFLVLTTEDDKREVREVGYIYLCCTHVGTLCLFGMFALLHSATGGFDLGRGAPISEAHATSIFLLALAGFGLKAGLMPLHIWLPGAHANAPSHVSAIMSSVLLKMGIYGLVRVTSLFPHPPLWWGGLVLGLGTLSAILGVAFAIGQHDLKRLLAYHSVENIGIICMGLGVALAGRSLGRADLVALGLAGALLHVWNHGLFKALLFLSAGSVIHACHTREIDRMGGLLRRMPFTGLAFLAGAVAICGLPPLNGFVSEFLVYLGLLHAAIQPGPTWLLGTSGAPALALVGALAVACFVKVFGAVFLGEARSEHPSAARESVPVMLIPMAVLGGCCAIIGLGSPLLAPVLDTAIAAWTEAPAETAPLLRDAPLEKVSLAGFLLLLLLAVAAWRLLARRRRDRARDVTTWDCGYAAPTARMQYTSSSFAQLIVSMFSFALRPVTHAPELRTVFPREATFESHVPDVVLDRLVLPAARYTERAFHWLHWLQRGNVHAYLIYILVTLIILLQWR